MSLIFERLPPCSRPSSLPCGKESKPPDCRDQPRLSSEVGAGGADSLALVAAVSVAALTVQMLRVGRHMKGAIEGRLRTSTGRAGAAAFAGVFLFTALMISREGMETSLLLLQLQQA